MSKIKCIKISLDEEGVRVDRLLRRHYPSLNQALIERYLRKGKIYLNEKKVKASYNVQIGEELCFPDFRESFVLHKTNEIDKKTIIDTKIKEVLLNSILYQDEDIIVINKPPGLSVKGGTKVKTSLVDYFQFLSSNNEDKLRLVHRLDKDTSGVLVLAKRAKVASYLGKIFQDREVEKYYWALCVGSIKNMNGKISLPLLKKKGPSGKEKIYVDKEGKKAVTFYKIIDRLADKIAFVELNPITGRTHQLRVHMLEVGMPIIGDGKYGGKLAFVNDISKKLHLHAREMLFSSPNGKKYKFTAPVPRHFKESCHALGISSNF